MAGTDPFKVEGKIVKVLSDRTFRVQLANGHLLLGFVPAKARRLAGQFIAGQKVLVQLSPYDLSEGRIILEKN